MIDKFLEKCIAYEFSQLTLKKSQKNNLSSATTEDVKSIAEIILSLKVNCTNLVYGEDSLKTSVLGGVNAYLEGDKEISSFIKESRGYKLAEFLEREHFVGNLQAFFGKWII